jgi:hypothetical protein
MIVLLIIVDDRDLWLFRKLFASKRKRRRWGIGQICFVTRLLQGALSIQVSGIVLMNISFFLMDISFFLIDIFVS